MSNYFIEDLKRFEQLDINKWQKMATMTKKDAVLIFQNIDEAKTKELIDTLPFFPYMSKIEYHNLNKQF